MTNTRPPNKRCEERGVWSDAISSCRRPPPPPRRARRSRTHDPTTMFIGLLRRTATVERAPADRATGATAARRSCCVRPLRVEVRQPRCPRHPSSPLTLAPIRRAIDFSVALNKSIAALLALARPDRVDSFGLFDLGGATLDLCGGVFKISEPVAIPVGTRTLRCAQARSSRAAPFATPTAPCSPSARATGLQRAGHARYHAGRVQSSRRHLARDARRGAVRVRRPADQPHDGCEHRAGDHDRRLHRRGHLAPRLGRHLHQRVARCDRPARGAQRANATGTAILLSHGQHDAMVEDIIIFSGMVGVRSGTAPTASSECTRGTSPGATAASASSSPCRGGSRRPA